MMIVSKLTQKITRKKIAALSLAITIFVVLNPLLLPIRVSPPTEDFYNVIVKELPKGSVIYFGWSIGGTTLYQYYADGISVVLKLLFENKHKVIFIPLLWAESPIQILDQLRRHNMYGAKYGEDYVILPYIVGDEAAVALVAESLERATQEDIYGNPLSDLPLTQKIKSIRDANLAITTYYTFTHVDYYIRQWCVPYKIKMMTMASYATVSAWYGKDKYVIGNINWIRGFAELEYMTKIPGEEIITMDARNLNVFYILVLVAIGTIGHLSTKLTKTKVEGELRK
jgi:hypothetical protein